MFARTRLLAAVALSSVVMLGLVAAPATAQAPAAVNAQDEVSILWHDDNTFNRITCDNNIGIPDEITAKSWGISYPRSTKIRIAEQITINGDLWRTRTRVQWTSSSGSWSTPLVYYDTFLGGKYQLYTRVTRYSNGLYLGAQFSSCTL